MPSVRSDAFVERLRSALEQYDGHAARDTHDSHDTHEQPGEPDDEPIASDFARATPVYFVGDSQSLIFRDRVYKLDPPGRRYVVARTKYCPGLCAKNFTDERGALNPAVIAALRGEHLVVADELVESIAYHRSADRHWRGMAAIEGRARSSPAVVFMCGSLDGTLILRELGADADFNGAGFADVQALVDRYLRPYARGLRLVQSWGLDRIFVHSVVPPQYDDEVFAEQFGMRISFAARAKLFALVNDSLARMAATSGCGFVDSADYTEESGALRAEFVHDAFHFNQRAALLSVNAVVRKLSAVRNATPNGRRAGI